MNDNSLRLVGMIAVVAMASSVPAGAAGPADRYTYPSAQTVYDVKTKLIWQRTAPATTYAWMAAKTYCANLGATLGGTGWRLPTIKELHTIVDDSRSGPSIDPTAFPATAASYFWSASPVAGIPSLAWILTFASGNTNYSDISPMNAVRCVR